MIECLSGPTACAGLGQATKRPGQATEWPEWGKLLSGLSELSESSCRVD